MDAVGGRTLTAQVGVSNIPSCNARSTSRRDDNLSKSVRIECVRLMRRFTHFMFELVTLCALSQRVFVRLVDYSCSSVFIMLSDKFV